MPFVCVPFSNAMLQDWYWKFQEDTRTRGKERQYKMGVDRTKAFSILVNVIV